MILSREHIQEVVKDYFSKKPVTKVWLFGSYARDEADENSDLDILIEIKPGSGVGLKYLSWNEEIEPILNKKVEIVSAGGISEYVAPFINADKKLIYEK